MQFFGDIDVACVEGSGPYEPTDIQDMEDMEDDL